MSSSSFICDIPSDVLVPPEFIVNLDLPPTVRWQHILRLYINQLRQAEETIETMVKDIVGSWAGPLLETVLTTLMAGVTQLGLVYYGQELKGVSEDTGIQLGKLVLMQLIYECVACCTSIVCQNKETKTPMHIRTMDWELDILRPLTIDVDFQRNGQTMYKATTWVGYVGILTGMRVQNGYSVSVNFRNTRGQFITNFKAALTRGWPVGFLIREILESVTNYDSAVECLAQSSLIAPCYLTICGTSQSQTFGTLLTRRQTSEENRWTLLQSGPIIQTNIDHWSSAADENILFSIERRHLCQKELSQMVTINEYELWMLLSKYPVCNEITIYGTFMCPEYGIYHTRIPREKHKFRSQNNIQFISLNDIQSHSSVRKAVKNEVCVKCKQTFDINDNAGGSCIHTGVWHEAYEECSFLKCGFHLGIKGSIGKQHWSCCYSLHPNSNTCTASDPHTFLKSK